MVPVFVHNSTYSWARAASIIVVQGVWASVDPEMLPSSMLPGPAPILKPTKREKNPDTTSIPRLLPTPRIPSIQSPSTIQIAFSKPGRRSTCVVTACATVARATTSTQPLLPRFVQSTGCHITDRLSVHKPFSLCPSNGRGIRLLASAIHRRLPPLGALQSLLHEDALVRIVRWRF